MNTPDPRPGLQALNALYARRAPVYDYGSMPVAPLRREAIALLGLQPGQTVLDVGAGTGLSLPGLSRAVGRTGRVVAVEPCETMMRQARQRARVDHLDASIDFLPATAEDADYASVLGKRRADAALFFFTHDVLQSEEGLERAFGAQARCSRRCGGTRLGAAMDACEQPVRAWCGDALDRAHGRPGVPMETARVPDEERGGRAPMARLRVCVDRLGLALTASRGSRSRNRRRTVVVGDGEA